MTSTRFDRALEDKSNGRFDAALQVLGEPYSTPRSPSEALHIATRAELLQLTGENSKAAPVAQAVLKSAHATAGALACCHVVLAFVAAEEGDVRRSESRFRHALKFALESGDQEQLKFALESGDQEQPCWIQLGFISCLADRWEPSVTAHVLGATSPRLE